MERERITVLSGPLQGHVVPVEGTLNIGRSPDNGLQLNEMQVSRRHAVIRQTPTGTLIQDLGSGNGTYVGEQRIIEHRLANGDILSIGPVELRFECAGARESRAFDPGTSVRFHEHPESTVRADTAQRVYETFFQRSEPAAPDGTGILHAQRRLQAIYEANQVIASERDLQRLFARVLDQVFALTPAHNGVILLKPEGASELVTEYVKSKAQQPEVSVSTTIIHRAFENGEAVLTYDAAGDSRFDSGESIIAENIASAMCAPLSHQDETLGVIYVDTRGATNAFSDGDLEMLVALAGPAAIAIKNAQYVAKLEQAYHDTLIAIANAIELRDHYTVGHTWRVTNFALEMARTLGWDEEALRRCEMGGVLHDVGKIAIDDAILRKPGRLTAEEYEKMQVHPERGARLMQDLEFLLPLIPFALYHHERYDGSGYPFGLSGEKIPIEGRLLAVADAFDAMTSHRPYRKGMDPETAIAEIERGKGVQFDPECADALIRAYRDGRIDRILQDYYRDKQSLACPFCSTYTPLPEHPQVGAEFGCGVCHRRLRLCHQNEVFYAELVAAGESSRTPIGPHRGANGD